MLGVDVLRISLNCEPEWPKGRTHPVIFLIDASTPLERRLLLGWIERHRPPDVEPETVQTASIPPSRRWRPGSRRGLPKLPGLLGEDDLPLVPLRVTWLAPERKGKRTASWVDLMKFGDPRDPDRFRQHLILRFRPDRCRIVAGEPATASELRTRLVAVGDEEEPDTSTFADYVALQAGLSLERAERQLRGSRYKVPKFVARDLLGRRSVRSGIRELASETGSSVEEVTRRVARYLREIAATHSPYVIDLVAHGTRLLISEAYGDRLHYDGERLRELYRLGQKHPLVFLPSHKSYLDKLALQLALYENDLPPNHTAGGININFFPVGPVVRRSGVFFIRRTFRDNPIYKFVLRRYIHYLIEKRFPLEWYIEGGRSRSGKLLPPRYGLLAYVVDAYCAGASEDVVLIPVSIAYDQIQDVGSYIEEQAGGTKRAESAGRLVGFIRSLRKRYGSIHLRFGRSLSLAEHFGPSPVASRFDPEEINIAIRKLAFEVAVRINEVTPITPISLVTLALLGQRGRALSAEQTLAALEPFIRFVKQRDLPTTVEVRLDTPERVRGALEALTEHGVVSRFDGGSETVYAIAADQHLAAAYYRNTIIHFFVDTAITELALISAARPNVSHPEQEFWREAMRLRDLLKFEFFFKRKEEFRTDLEHELHLADPLWRQRFTSGNAGMILDGLRPFMAHWVLRPFFESYVVVADVLSTWPAEVPVDHKALQKQSLALGKQYLLQGRIGSAESISQELFGTGLEICRNAGLLERGADVAERRATMAEELWQVAASIKAGDAYEATRE